MKLIVRFFEWIKKIPYQVACLLIWVIYYPYSIIFTDILDHYHIEYSQNVSASIPDLIQFLDISRGEYHQIIVPFLEEMVFRWLPMILLFGLVLNPLWRNRGLTKEKYYGIERRSLLIYAIVSNIIFGITHGNVYNIFIQGVAGVNYIIIYLRGYYIRRDKGLRTRAQLIPLVEAYVFHFFTNQMFHILYYYNLGHILWRG